MVREGWPVRKLRLALPLLLGACAPMTDWIAPSYVPVPIHVYDQVRYSNDVVECRAAGQSYQPDFALGTIVTRTVDGATSNTSLIPVSPLVPAFGAAGGAAGALGDGLDLASRQHANVFRNCLFEETRRDGAAILADPRD